MKLKFVAAAAVLVLALAGAFLFAHRTAAPDVAFTTLGGQTFRTADLHGQVVLINFWATSCSSCIKEMPALKRMQQAFQARGYQTVAVAMEYDPPARVAAFMVRGDLPFTFVLDHNGRIARRFGDVRLTPTSFIVNRRGEIVRRIVGQPDFDKLHALIDKLLTEPT